MSRFERCMVALLYVLSVAVSVAVCYAVVTSAQQILEHEPPAQRNIWGQLPEDAEQAREWLKEW